MDYKLYDASFLPQLSRILGSASDTKTAYVISLAEGKKESDLLSCLNFRPTGAGYFFDPALLTSDLGVLLGTGNDCTRNIVHDILSFSKCNITCNVVGKPTHVILGGLAPFVFEIGKDVKLLSVTTGTDVDKTGEGSVVSVAAFKLKFTGLDFVKFTQMTVGSISFRSAYSDPRYRAFDDYATQVVRQIGTKDFQIDFSTYGNMAGGRNGVLCLTSEIGSNNNPVDGICVYTTAIDTSLSRYFVGRAPTNNSEIFMTAGVNFAGVAMSLKRVNGITKLYANNTEVPLYAVTDTSLTTPINYNLSYDLSTAVICRIGKFDAPSNDSSSAYQVNNMVVKQLF